MRQATNNRRHTMKIRDAIEAIAAGTMTIEEAKSRYERSSWKSFSLGFGAPYTPEQVKAYWAVLDAMPDDAPRTIRTVSDEDVAAYMKARGSSYEVCGHNHDHDEE
jgi:hypothetical protein